MESGRLCKNRTWDENKDVEQESQGSDSRSLGTNKGRTTWRIIHLNGKHVYLLVFLINVSIHPWTVWKPFWMRIILFHCIFEASTSIHCHCLRAKLRYVIFSLNAYIFLQKPQPVCSQVLNTCIDQEKYRCCSQRVPESSLLGWLTMITSTKKLSAWLNTMFCEPTDNFCVEQVASESARTQILFSSPS